MRYKVQDFYDSGKFVKLSLMKCSSLNGTSLILVEIVKF